MLAYANRWSRLWSNANQPKRRVSHARRAALLWDFCEARTLLTTSSVFSINSVSVSEGSAGNTIARFTVTLLPPNLEQTATVNFTTVDGSATVANHDYQSVSGTLTFPPDQSTETIDVPIPSDTRFDIDRFFTVVLSNPTNATIGTGTGTGTILNDNPAPSLSVDNVNLPAPSSGLANAVFTVSLSAPSELPTTVHFATADGTATVADNDYQATSGDLTFAPGQVTKTVSVPIVGTTIYEHNETFTLNLSNPTNATLARATATGTIVNVVPAPVVSISDAVISGSGASENAVFTVSLSAPSGVTTTVNFATADGTATVADNDYQPLSGTVTFAPNQTTQTISVHVFPDTLFELDEFFTVNLTNPTDATLGRASGTAVIPNTVAEPSLTINDVTVNQNSSGAQNAVFTVTMSAPSEVSTTVAFNTADGTAKIGDGEYQFTSGTLTFAPHQLTQTITVPVLGNPFVEPDKTFFVVLNGSINATLARGQGTATIHNTNLGGAVSFSTDLYSADASTDSQAIVTVTRTGGNAAGVSIHYSTADASGVAGVDYLPASGVLNFGLGDTSETFTVPVIPDFTGGDPLTVHLTLDTPGGGGALGAQSTATLVLVRPVSLIVVNTHDSGPGSLRQVILTANAIPGPNTVLFAIPGSGPFVISPSSPLPVLTGVTNVNATSQPGYAGRPLVALDGAHAGPDTNGLTLLAARSVVQGLAIGGFGGSGILIQGGGHDLIQGDYLGTDVTGSVPVANAGDGLTIVNSPGNTVGGITLATRDLISGNGAIGVRIVGPGSTGNIVLGDLIGTNVDGTVAIGNRQGGVFVDSAPGNWVGMPGAGNLIAGNTGAGVVLSGPTATGNMIVSNRIGTNMAGTSPLGNTADGIYLAGASHNTIGGLGQGNVISANGLTGIRLENAAASGNVIQSNHIGTDASGNVGLGNRYDGIFVNGAPGNTIGGTAPGAGNLISGNGSCGIQIFTGGASGNLVQGNFVGTDVSGHAAIANANDGVFINQAPGNTIGGTTPGAGNLISGNGSVGLQILGAGSSGNVVQGNHIGTNVDGVPNLGNNYGVFLNKAGANVIGGSAPGANNDIAGNRTLDVRVDGGAGTPIAIASSRRTVRRPARPVVRPALGHHTPQGPKTRVRPTHVAVHTAQRKGH